MINPNLIAILGVIAVGLWGIYRLRQNFSEGAFFKIGMYLFSVQGLANTYGIILEWNFLPIYTLISKIATTLFSFVLAYFFYYLMSKAPANMGGAGTQLTPEEVNKFLKEDIENG